MKLQVSLSALVLCTPSPVAFAAWTPSLIRQRGAASSAIHRPYSVQPLQLTPSNSTNSKDSSSRSSTNNEPQDVNPDLFAAELDQGLEELQKKIDPAMDAYTQALRGMNQDPPTTTGPTYSAGQGFGQPPASANVDKKKAFMEKNRRASIPVTRDIIADQIMDQLESQSPPPPAKEEKSPRDLIQEAKKAKELPKQGIPSATAKAMQMDKPEAIIPPPPPPANPVAEEKKTYFPPTPIENKPKKEEPVARKTYFPPQEEPTVPKKTIIPPPPKQDKTYFPPTPIAKKPDVVVKKEPEQPIASKAEEIKKEEPKVETPIVGQTTNPFVKPAAAEKVETPKEEIPAKVDPVSKIGSEIPMEIGMAAEQVVGKIKVETTTPPASKKTKKKLELPKIDLQMPKLEIPEESVDKAKELLQNAGGAIFDAAQVVLKDGKGWAISVRNSINTARVEELDMTYEEAFQKMGKSGRGLFKICALVGSAIKETAMIFVDQVEKSAPVKKISPAATTTRAAAAAAKPVKSAVAPQAAAKPETKRNLSYLEQLQNMGGPTLGEVKEEEKQEVKPSGRLNLRDIVLPEPDLDSEPEAIVEEEISVEEVKAKEESEKLQASVGDLKKSFPSKDSKSTGTPKMSKTQAVGKEKKKKGGPFFFLDLDDN